MSFKHYINLFGSGIRYWVCDIPIPLFEEMNKIRLNHKVEWEQLLFDFDFLKHFGYNHWSELSPHPEQTGFLLDPQNRIEIKQGSKFIARLRAHELTNSETLFPLYQTTISNSKPKSREGFKTIFLLHIEKGMIGKYMFETSDFSIEQLRFELNPLQEELFLSGIYLETKQLLKVQEDSLVIGTRVIIQT